MTIFTFTIRYIKSKIGCAILYSKFYKFNILFFTKMLFKIYMASNTSIKSFQSTIAETEAGIEMLSRLRPLYMKNWIRKKK